MAGQSKLTSDSVVVAYKGLNGGLNSTASPLTLQPNESSKLLNIDFDKFGSAKKRNGYIPLNANLGLYDDDDVLLYDDSDASFQNEAQLNSGAQITGLHWYEKRDGTNYLIVIAGDKIYSNDLSTTFTDITGSATLTAGSLWKFVTFYDTVFMTNGTDTPLKWTGTGNVTAMTLPTNITQPKWIEQFMGYTFVADSYNAAVRQGSRLNWSIINTGDTWLDTDFAYISWNDGQDITGLKTLGDRIVIFKNRSIWIGQFTGDVDIPFQFQKTQSHVGCTSGYSIVAEDNGLLFFGEDGIYFFDGNQSERLTNRINYTLLSENNTSRNYLTCGMYQKFKNRYWCSQFTGSNTQANQVVTFDNFNNALSLYDGMAPSAMCMVYDGTKERPFFGDYKGWVYEADTGKDDYPEGTQTAIDGYWYSRWLDYDDLTNQKGIGQFDVYFEINAATVSVTYSYDFEEGDTYTLPISTGGSSSLWDTTLIWDSGTWAGSGGSHYRLDLTGRGRVVRIGFKNSALSETFRIDGIGQLVHLETNQ
jgi:hypothetical protein